MADGYIKLARGLLDKPIFQNEKLLKVWIWCLLKATHKGTDQLVGLRTIHLEPGQFIFGRDKAAVELKMPPSTVWRQIQFLKNNESLDIKTDNKFSLISIVNWELYQVELFKADSNTDNTRTGRGQVADTNKNVKNVKKDIYTPVFLKFWEVYPRSKEKQTAFKVWSARIKSGDAPEDMILAAERYALECEINETEERFIKHAATFLGPSKPFREYLAEDWTPPKKKPPPNKPPTKGRDLPVL